MNTSKLILCCGISLLLFGCASTNKSEFDSTVSPEAAVSEITSLRVKADKLQAELLSYDAYSNGAENLEKAQKGLSENYEKQFIIDKAAIARAEFEKAIQNSEIRQNNALRMLQARKSALDAGLENSDRLKQALLDVDDDLRDETGDFDEVLEPKAFSEFQKKYFELEIRAVQFRELDSVRGSIQIAEQDDAGELAPKSLRTALLDLKEAENIIAQSPREPEIHMGSVDKSIASSVLLTEVMDVIANAEGTPEDIALKIVYQNRELAKLSENVGNLEKNLKVTKSSLEQTEGKLVIQSEALKSTSAELNSTKSNLEETESALILQNEELEKSSMQIRFQHAMDEAVKQFSEDEASVYQQGSKLIFRLKKINFASGTSYVPKASKPLLSKIDQIIKSIRAELVAVQGHTDSVGAAELNKSLSTKRAVSVANYLASLAGGYKIGYVGYGESKPIASNETKEGRAINRRVDLVVTAKK